MHDACSRVYAEKAAKYNDFHLSGVPGVLHGGDSCPAALRACHTSPTLGVAPVQQLPVMDDAPRRDRREPIRGTARVAALAGRGTEGDTVQARAGRTHLPPRPPFHTSGGADPQMKPALLFLAAAALLAGAVPAAAQLQGGWDPGRVQLTRADLQKLLADYEAAAASPAHSGRYRAQARAEANAIRARLRDGDVQPGDQIALVVEGQQALSDTFSVRAGGVLFLPQIGDVSVAGLLRSEVESRLHDQLAR